MKTNRCSYAKAFLIGMILAISCLIPQLNSQNPSTTGCKNAASNSAAAKSDTCTGDVTSEPITTDTQVLVENATPTTELTAAVSASATACLKFLEKILECLPAEEQKLLIECAQKNTDKEYCIDAACYVEKSFQIRQKVSGAAQRLTNKDSKSYFTALSGMRGFCNSKFKEDSTCTSSTTAATATTAATTTSNCDPGITKVFDGYMSEMLNVYNTNNQTLAQFLESLQLVFSERRKYLLAKIADQKAMAIYDSTGVCTGFKFTEAHRKIIVTAYKSYNAALSAFAGSFYSGINNIQKTISSSNSCKYVNPAATAAKTDASTTPANSSTSGTTTPANSSTSTNTSTNTTAPRLEPSGVHLRSLTSTTPPVLCGDTSTTSTTPAGCNPACAPGASFSSTSPCIKPCFGPPPTAANPQPCLPWGNCTTTNSSNGTCYRDCKDASSINCLPLCPTTASFRCPNTTCKASGADCCTDPNSTYNSVAGSQPKCECKTGFVFDPATNVCKASGTSTNTCLTSQVTCPNDNSCKNTIAECCPQGQVLSNTTPKTCVTSSTATGGCAEPNQICPDNSCKAPNMCCATGQTFVKSTTVGSPGTCQTSSTCTSPQILCPNNTCGTADTCCPTGSGATFDASTNKCNCPSGQFMCVGKCQATDCTGGSTAVCPDSTKPIKCPNGTCVTAQADCGTSTTCPTTQVKCPDGSCKNSATECITSTATACPTATQIKCPDGSCKNSSTECVINSCPSATPTRCPDQKCVVAVADCAMSTACPTTTPFKCPDGSCKAAVVECISMNTAICPSPQVKCPDGKCANAVTECVKTCPTGFITCPNGACMANATGCVTNGDVICTTAGEVPCIEVQSAATTAKFIKCATTCPTGTQIFTVCTSPAVMCKDSTTNQRSCQAICPAGTTSATTNNIEFKPCYLSNPSMPITCSDKTCVIAAASCPTGTTATCVTATTPVYCSDKSCAVTPTACPVGSMPVNNNTGTNTGGSTPSGLLPPPPTTVSINNAAAQATQLIATQFTGAYVEPVKYDPNAKKLCDQLNNFAAATAATSTATVKKCSPFCETQRTTDCFSTCANKSDTNSGKTCLPSCISNPELVPIEQCIPSCIPLLRTKHCINSSSSGSSSSSFNINNFVAGPNGSSSTMLVNTTGNVTGVATIASINWCKTSTDKDCKKICTETFEAGCILPCTLYSTLGCKKPCADKQFENCCPVCSDSRTFNCVTKPAQKCCPDPNDAIYKNGTTAYPTDCITTCASTVSNIKAGVACCTANSTDTTNCQKCVAIMPPCCDDFNSNKNCNQCPSIPIKAYCAAGCNPDDKTLTCKCLPSCCKDTETAGTNGCIKCATQSNQKVVTKVEPKINTDGTVVVNNSLECCSLNKQFDCKLCDASGNAVARKVKCDKGQGIVTNCVETSEASCPYPACSAVFTTNCFDATSAGFDSASTFLPPTVAPRGAYCEPGLPCVAKERQNTCIAGQPCASKLDSSGNVPVDKPDPSKGEVKVVGVTIGSILDSNTLAILKTYLSCFSDNGYTEIVNIINNLSTTTFNTYMVVNDLPSIISKNFASTDTSRQIGDAIKSVLGQVGTASTVPDAFFSCSSGNCTCKGCTQNVSFAYSFTTQPLYFQLAAASCSNKQVTVIAYDLDGTKPAIMFRMKGPGETKPKTISDVTGAENNVCSGLMKTSSIAELQAKGCVPPMNPDCTAGVDAALKTQKLTEKLSSVYTGTLLPPECSLDTAAGEETCLIYFVENYLCSNTLTLKFNKLMPTKYQEDASVKASSGTLSAEAAQILSTGGFSSSGTGRLRQLAITATSDINDAKLTILVTAVNTESSALPVQVAGATPTTYPSVTAQATSLNTLSVSAANAARAASSSWIGIVWIMISMIVSLIML